MLRLHFSRPELNEIARTITTYCYLWSVISYIYWRCHRQQAKLAAENRSPSQQAASGSLKRIRHNIPKEYYKSIYFSLFESHLSYCITVFGKANRSLTNRLFITQKHCMRILFGDLDKYIDKFKTCARTRPMESQRLGQDFFKRENTKPLFYKQGILSFW